MAKRPFLFYRINLLLIVFQLSLFHPERIPNLARVLNQIAEQGGAADAAVEAAPAEEAPAEEAPVGRPQPMTPWGKKSRGIKTRNSKARSEKLIIRHRKGNK